MIINVDAFKIILLILIGALRAMPGIFDGFLLFNIGLFVFFVRIPNFTKEFSLKILISPRQVIPDDCPNQWRTEHFLKEGRHMQIQSIMLCGKFFFKYLIFRFSLQNLVISKKEGLQLESIFDFSY